MTLPPSSLPRVATTLSKLARDAFFVGVGTGVLAFQKAQVQRREWQEALEERRRSSGR